MSREVEKAIETALANPRPTTEHLGIVLALVKATRVPKNHFRTAVETLYEETPSNTVLFRQEFQLLKGIFSAEKLLDAHSVGDQFIQIDSDSTLLFETPEEEFQQACVLISDIRDLIQSSKHFDEGKKTKLYKRITAIEIEFNKTKGMFHTVLGAIVEIGETAGQVGKDSKPLFDRLAELRGIAGGNIEEQQRLENPAVKKRLPPPKDDEKE